MSVPKKYEHIDFTPPKGVSAAAEKGLDLRRKATPANRGGLTPAEASKEGIGSGVQRAVNLKNRNQISPDTVRQMSAFFARHEKNKGVSTENRGTPWNDKGYVAWLLWGGDPGKAWADKVVKQMNAADENEKGKSASRVASRFVSKRACIVARIPVGNTVALLKNRDRNYNPEVRVHHEIRNGVEILYMKDVTTGWVEGINEFGIGIVNAALLVQRDENEKEIAKTLGKKSKDGARIIAALEKRTVDEAVDSVLNHEGGVKGHTIVSDTKSAKLVEMTSKHTAVVKDVELDDVIVRTNHGIEYPQAGYTSGENYVSSVARREQAISILKEVPSVRDIAPYIYKHRRKDYSDPYSMVRDTDNMKTVTQMVLDLKQHRMMLYLIPGKVRYLGYVNDLPDKYKPKIKFDVYKYTDIDGDGEFDVIRRKTKSGEDIPPTTKVKSASRIALRWLHRRAAKKKLRIFDFDETLAVSEGSIRIKTASGEVININSVAFTHYTAQDGDEFDFTDFNDINHPRIIKKNWKRFLEAVADEDSDVTILTARPRGVESSIAKFLASHDIEGVRIKALQSSDPFDKARWIDDAIEEGGYQDIEFLDDSHRNVEAVNIHAKAHIKKGIHIESEQPPLPTESSFDGPPSKKSFRSDNPTKATSVYNAPKSSGGGSKADAGLSDWWGSQTPHFQEKYCEEHKSSRYCKSASVGVRMAAKDPNAALKKSLLERSKKSKSKKVSEYITKFMAKLDVTGPAAGFLMDSLEANFHKTKKEGDLRGFSEDDMDTLFAVLFGYRRPKGQ